MIHFVFDLDDTLLFHQGDINYRYICEDKELSYYLSTLRYPKYVLTNGTKEHAAVLLDSMKITDQFKCVYAREDMDPYMKPHPLCYQKIVKEIVTDKGSKNIILFFDDLLSNLQEAYNHNWITIWIHPDSHLSSKYEFVDYAFPNIVTALIHFNKKAKIYT